MIFDHLSKEFELWTFETITLTKGLTVISKLQMDFTGFLKVFKIIENLEIWAWSDCYVTGTFYQWCHITDANDAIMHQLPNESTKLLNILFKNLCEWYCMLNYNRKIDTIWNSLFDDKSSYLRCIQDVVIKFASAINIT